MLTFEVMASNDANCNGKEPMDVESEGTSVVSTMLGKRTLPDPESEASGAGTSADHRQLFFFIDRASYGRTYKAEKTEKGKKLLFKHSHYE